MQDSHTYNLRNSIKTFKVDRTKLFCSIAKKQQGIMSVFSNQRLLVLDNNRHSLYYVNDINPDFQTIPPPKNQQANIQNLGVKKDPESQTIEFSFIFKSQKKQWRFIFATKQLADQWYQLIKNQKQTIQFQKNLPLLPQKVLQSIVDVAQPQTVPHNDIVRQPERSIIHDQSRMYPHQRKMGSVVARIDNETQPQQIKSQDWNYQFYKKRNMQTLYQFRQAAFRCFFDTVRTQLSSKAQIMKDKDPLINYLSEQYSIKIARKYTQNARKLTSQYKNYHFIIQATINSFIVGVPLACLIQFDDIVGLVKAKLPAGIPQTTIPPDIQDMQRYTRIKNKILLNCKILDLTQTYRPQQGQVYFLDDLVDYLPVNLEFPLKQLTLVRPQFMLDHVDHFIFSGQAQLQNRTDSRAILELSMQVMDKAKVFASSFYKKDFPIVGINQLKIRLHEAGLNTKYLPAIYSACPSTNIKKYLYTAMTAQLIKQYIFSNLVSIRINDRSQPTQRIIQQIMGWILSGSNNRSNDLWKQIALIFKQKYKTVLNNKQILPAFFLVSILQLIPAQYDLSKIDRKKKIFQEKNIIQRNFVEKSSGVVKIYDKFQSEQLQNLKQQCKNQKNEQLASQVLKIFYSGSQGQEQRAYQLGGNRQWMIEYLSLYYPPAQIASQQDVKVAGLYDQINTQPPTHFTFTLTSHYLDWCNKKAKIQQFRTCFDKAIPILSYWLDEDHPIKSDFLQNLANHNSIINHNAQMIKYMRQSLSLSLKFWGSDHAQTGQRLFQMAQCYLKSNHKNQAGEHFSKAKQNFQKNKTVSSSLGKSLMRLASICLSNLEYDKAIQYAKDSLKRIEEHQRKVASNGTTFAPVKMKTYQILARTYQITQSTIQAKELSLNVAKRFNQSKDKQIYEQMIKISVAASIYRASVDRCRSFLSLCQRIKEESVDSGLNMGSQSNKSQTAIDRMMYMSRSDVIMQKFIFKFQQFDRYMVQQKGKKKPLNAQMKEFMEITKNIVEIIGIGYIRELVEERIICSSLQ